MASPGVSQLSPMQEALGNKSYQYFALGFAFLVWLIFVQSAIKQSHLDWQLYLIIGRASMSVGACLCIMLVAKFQLRNVAPVYFIACMLLQASFACLENGAKTDYYKYVPHLLMMNCLTYSGLMSVWLKRFGPLAAASLLVPLAFKDQELFSSVGSFAFSFTENIAVTAVSIVFLKVSTDKFQALHSSLQLQSELARVKSIESEKYARRLSEARAEIERGEKDRALGRIVTLISHDVRKPFALLKVLLDGIRSAANGHEMRVFAKAALPELQRAIDSVDGLLQDVMQIGSLDANLFLEETPIELLLDSVLAEVFRGQPDSDVAIGAAVEEALTLRIDQNKVRRVFSNIISNACQAISWRGQIWISSKARQDQRVEIILGNAGSAIPESVIPNLFDAFFTSNKRGGTGLGLAIARKWVEAHGGTITCHSRVDDEHPAGLVEFVFDLPAGENHPEMVRPLLKGHSSAYRMDLNFEPAAPQPQTVLAELEHLRAAVASGEERPLSVIALDDEVAFLDGLRSTIESLKLGTTVQFYQHVNEDRQCLGTADLYLIDFDLGRPDRNGLDVISDVRAVQPQAFICLHTNRTDAETFRGALTAGADAVYTKPITSEHMAKLLIESMRRLHLSQMTNAKPEAPQFTPPKKLKVAFVDDSLVMRLSWKRALAHELELVLFTRPDEIMKTEQKFDIIVTDMNFDNSVLSGNDVAVWASQNHSATPILLCSNETEMPGDLFDGRVKKDAEPTASVLLDFVRARGVDAWPVLA